MTSTTPTTRPALVMLITGALCAGAGAGAQPEPDPLAGPRVSEQAQAPTLVHRGYDGRLMALDAPPEVAALDLLDLSEEDWARVEAVLGERASAIDKVVIENVRTLVELQAATSTGDTQAQRRLLGTIVDELRDLRRSGRLVDQIARAVPEDKADAYRRLVRERHMARFEELKIESEKDGSEDPDTAAFRRLIVEALGQEIKGSYERVVTQRIQDFSALLSRLDLDEQTEGVIRRMVEDFGQETALNPTPGQRRELFGRIYRALPTEAQGRLLAVLREGDGG